MKHPKITKTIIEFLGSFRVRVTVVLILSLFFVMGLSDLLIYRFVTRAQFAQLRDKLAIIAQTAALGIDGDLLREVPLSRDGINTPQYQRIARQLARVKEATPIITYIYTLVPTAQPGMWQFAVDPFPAAEKKRWGPTSFPGDKYYAARFPEMLKAWRAPTADRKLMVDEWGVTLSGYAPVKDSSGNTVAVLGVDMSAKDVYLTGRHVTLRTLLVFLLGVVISIILGLVISKRITDRIERLVEGTRRIAADEFDFKVKIQGHDEISELADSFNKMASSLAESKKRLQDYFYRVVQSLVRILEAKDEYTRGHSGRVAEYAKAIALRMGFSQEKAALVEKVASLHDIGKLVIHENILNKKGPLTDEEWKIIREHPLIAEEALKPVFLDDEILAMVRSHHERFDGTGYPDHLQGDRINIFAQIISVADSFDAMTSARAYKATLSKEAAIQELQRNAGTQFNTQIVKAFLKVLEEH